MTGDEPDPDAQRVRRRLRELADFDADAAYTVGLGIGAYLDDSPRGRVLRNNGRHILIQVATVVEKLPATFKDACDDDWVAIGRMRNLIAHHYDKVDDRLVFTALAHRIPNLLGRLGLDGCLRRAGLQFRSGWIGEPPGQRFQFADLRLGVVVGPRFPTRWTGRSPAGRAAESLLVSGGGHWSTSGASRPHSAFAIRSAASRPRAGMTGCRLSVVVRSCEWPRTTWDDPGMGGPWDGTTLGWTPSDSSSVAAVRRPSCDRIARTPASCRRAFRDHRR